MIQYIPQPILPLIDALIATRGWQKQEEEKKLKTESAVYTYTPRSQSLDIRN